MHKYHTYLKYFKYIIYINNHYFNHHKYKIFHTNQINIIKNYPTIIKTKIKNYNKKIYKFFEIKKNQPINFLLLF